MIGSFDPDFVGASLLAMGVNDNARLLNKRDHCERLAPTG
jgi:hypothetical protein